MLRRFCGRLLDRVDARVAHVRVAHVRVAHSFISLSSAKFYLTVSVL